MRIVSTAAGIGPLNSTEIWDDPFNPTLNTWHEAHSATAENWSGVTVSGDMTRTGFVLLGVGPAGSEEVVATYYLGRFIERPLGGYYAPVFIPAGSRVSVALQSAIAASMFIEVSGHPTSFFELAPQIFAHLDIGPIETANSNFGEGPTITSGLAGVWGSWTELQPANQSIGNVLQAWNLNHVYKHMAFLPRRAGTMTSPQIMNFELATGSVGSETLIATASFNIVSHTPLLGVTWFPSHDIPLGTRFSARLKTDVVDNENIQILMMGLR